MVLSVVEWGAQACKVPWPLDVVSLYWECCGRVSRRRITRGLKCFTGVHFKVIRESYGAMRGTLIMSVTVGYISPGGHFTATVLLVCG